MGTVDTQCTRDSCGTGSIKALFLGAALKKQTGEKCRDKNKRFRRREKSDGLIREYTKIGGRMIDDHHQKQKSSQNIELNESLHLEKLRPPLPRNSIRLRGVPFMDTFSLAQSVPSYNGTKGGHKYQTRQQPHSFNINGCHETWCAGHPPPNRCFTGGFYSYFLAQSSVRNSPISRRKIWYPAGLR